jgi:peptide/nickel transport system ATP-binding protein
VDAGSVLLDGTELLTLNKKQMRAARKDVQMVFQDPYSSMNPSMVVGDIIGEPLEVQAGMRGSAKNARVAELLEAVGLSGRYRERYPYEFSGGQRQRIAIARALANRPKLVILDEAVSALDVSTQNQIINLLEDLQHEMGVSFVFIAHDLAVVRHIARRTVVLYLGKIMEEGPSERLFSAAAHPYTEALLSAVPIPNPVVQAQRKRIVLSGEPPDPTRMPAGCPFAARCSYAMDICSQTMPEPTPVNGGGTWPATCTPAGRHWAAVRSAIWPPRRRKGIVRAQSWARARAGATFPRLLTGSRGRGRKGDTMELISQNGFGFVFRWLHVLAGITWIGLLYYFNFVQVPAFAQYTDAMARNHAIDKVARRALDWFRYAMLATVATGLLIVIVTSGYGQYGPSGEASGGWGGAAAPASSPACFWRSSWPTTCGWSSGRTRRSCSPTPLASSRASLPTRVRRLPAARRSWRPARTCSSASPCCSSWCSPATTPSTTTPGVAALKAIYWIITLVVVAVLEANALGFMPWKAEAKKGLNWFYESVQNVIIGAVGLWVIMWLMWEILF